MSRRYHHLWLLCSDIFLNQLLFFSWSIAQVPAETQPWDCCYLCDHLGFRRPTPCQNNFSRCYIFQPSSQWGRFSEIIRFLKNHKLGNCTKNQDCARALTKVLRQRVPTFPDTKGMNSVGPAYAAPPCFAVLHMCKTHKLSGKWLFKGAKGIH